MNLSVQKHSSKIKDSSKIIVDLLPVPPVYQLLSLTVYKNHTLHRSLLVGRNHLTHRLKRRRSRIGCVLKEEEYSVNVLY